MRTTSSVSCILLSFFLVSCVIHGFDKERQNQKQHFTYFNVGAANLKAFCAVDVAQTLTVSWTKIVFKLKNGRTIKVDQVV